MNIEKKDLRRKFLEFYQEKNHELINSSSVFPENDPTVLFTTAGMHPLVPYLLGEVHPKGRRLTGVQKCIRTSDIDEVGDSSHLTFFEMLGNWSLGDYFKEDAIKYSYEFLTSDKYLGIDKNRLYFTCFKGDEKIKKDEESFNIWKSLGVSEDHIYYLGKDDNFWILGSGVGPCGPSTEMYYDTGKDFCSDKCDPSCDCGKFLEIWNDVFMQYCANEDGSMTDLSQKNVDTGMGLERTITVLNNLESVYDTEDFLEIKNMISKLSNKSYEDNKRHFRIIMDHMRTSVFILGDDKKLVPSNTEAGYILRRLIRRAMRSLLKLEIDINRVNELVDVIVNIYKDVYSELGRNKNFITDEIIKEMNKFSKTLKSGEKHFYKIIKNTTKQISGSDAFKLFDTFGFPIEMTTELAKENNLEVDVDGFNEAFKEHQEKSKSIEAGTAKGGLADNSENSIKYHTLAHILLATLQEIYGKELIQKGCNINSERIRFDFNLDHKLSVEEKVAVTSRVNEIINMNLPVTMEEMTLDKAKEVGAAGIFTDRYSDVVKVYSIGEVSKEICGGPHVKSTIELGEFKIKKEESSSAGVRRIKGILVPKN